MYITRMSVHSTTRRLGTSRAVQWLVRRPRLVCAVVVLLVFVMLQGGVAAESGASPVDGTVEYHDKGTMNKGP